MHKSLVYSLPDPAAPLAYNVALYGTEEMDYESVPKR